MTIAVAHVGLLCAMLAACGKEPSASSKMAPPRSLPNPAVPAASEQPSSNASPTKRHPGPCATRIAWGSGDAPGLVTYTYDDQGRVVRAGWDGNGDGNEVETTRYEYPMAGRVVVIVGEGPQERREVRAFEGNLAIVQKECTPDGRVPEITCTFDPHGNLVHVDWTVFGGAQVDRLSYDYTCWR